MALGSSFASLMAELRAIESQFKTEPPQKDILQHREDIQNVTMTFTTRQQDTSRATSQRCEKEGEGSSEREKRTHKAPQILVTPAEDDTSRTRPEQWDTILPKSKASERGLWFGVNGRRQRPPQTSNSNFSDTAVHFAPNGQQGQDEERERRSQKEPEVDDWVVVADDFGVLVFLDDY